MQALQRKHHKEKNKVIWDAAMKLMRMGSILHVNYYIDSTTMQTK
jgi:hypothetical protein